MGNFKVGDIVVGNQDNKVVVEGQLYEVLAVDVGSGFEYIKTDLNPNNWVRSERFYLYKPAPQVEQDDPLPPAPESVMYFNSIRDKGNDQCITVRPDNDLYHAGTLCVSVHPRGDYDNYQSVVLDPDAALQLAHDLNRMANEIKRKERNKT